MAVWWRTTQSIYAVGRNYAPHTVELGSKGASAKPFWFAKPTSSLTHSGSPHHCFPGHSESIHEVELGVIIGTPARHVSPERALEHVAGYCVALDMTDRQGLEAAQKAGKPWTQCKGWDSACPVSDMVPAVYVQDPSKLHLWLKVNDESTARQSAPTSRMINPVSELISALSHVHTLCVGDLILTGTPEGASAVVPGDVITAGIEELGLEIRVPVVGTPCPAVASPGTSRSIYAIGRNYAAHASELGNQVPSSPFWFLKPAASLALAGAPHYCFPGSAESHHEVELGVVIGTPCCSVSPEEALDHIAGYCLVLDMTDRRGQNEAKKAGMPWTQCKGWDTSCPVSEMVPASRVPDPSKLTLWLQVNGETRQSASTSNMIFDVAHLIAAVSRVHTLKIGDFILTGTPEGVGPVMPGDVITAGITELGVELTVPIKA